MGRVTEAMEFALSAVRGIIRSNGLDEMAARLGEALYWTATIFVVLIVVWIVWGYMYNVSKGEPIIPIVALLFAAAIWLAGRACRFVLAGR